MAYDKLDDEWMYDENMVKEANICWNNSITPHVSKLFFSSEAQSKRRRDYVDSTYIDTLEGIEYYPQKRGSIILHWISPEQKKNKVQHLPK